MRFMILLLLSCVHSFGAFFIDPFVFQSGGGAWSPTTPANTLKQWLQANILPGVDSSDVTTWTASAGVNGTIPGGEDAPILRTGANGKNSLNTVQFDGTDDLMNGAFSGSQSQSYTVHLVFKRLGGSNVVLDGNADNTSRMVFRSNVTWEVYAGSTFTTLSDVPDANNNWHVLRLEVNGASTKYMLDGSSEFTVSTTPGADPLSGFTLAGNYIGAGSHSQTTFAELFIHDDILSAGDKADAYEYLYNKWHDGSDSWTAP